jgi:hypothetical protein
MNAMTDIHSPSDSKLLERMPDSANSGEPKPLKE